jgi:hypothetical protein
MKAIKKQDLLNLGFTEEYSTPEESGTEKGFYYYTYQINEDSPCLLITNSNDECVDDNYIVEFFDYLDIEIKDLNDLKELVAIIKRGIKTNG